MTTSIEDPPSTEPADPWADVGPTAGVSERRTRDGHGPPVARQALSGDALSLLVLGALAVLAGVLCYAVFQHTQGQPVRHGSSGAAPSVGSPEAEGDAPAERPGSAVRAAPPPEVPDIVRADFLAGDPWPDSAGSRDDGAVSWPMGLVDGRFTHGPPQGSDAASWLERWLGTKVRAIGAEVRFASGRSGSVALTAWSSSVLEATDSGVPATGMRLVAAPGAWQVVAIEGGDTSVLADGSWSQTGQTATFELLRAGDRLWVIDPTGRVTRISDPRVASLAGPYASWELREDDQAQQPAAFEEIWAG